MNETEFQAALTEELPRVVAALRRLHPEMTLPRQVLEEAARMPGRQRGRAASLPRARDEVFSWLLALGERLHVRLVRRADPRFRRRCVELLAQVQADVRRGIGRACRQLGVDPDDVVQDAFSRAVQYVETSEELERLPGTLDDARRWLTRIARNLAVDQRRAINRSRSTDLSDDPIAPQASNEDDALQQLRECLEHLTADERRVIDALLEGNKPAGIASLLQLEIKTVYYLLRRAKDHLRECLSRALPGEGDP